MVEQAQAPARAAAEAISEGVSTFSSLRYRDYRYLWLSQVGRSAAMWMEQIARPVLILQLTHSSLMLGLVVAARMVPQLLFGLFAGVITDRFDRKRIMLVAQVGTASWHLITAALILTGAIQAWQLFILAFATGTSMVFTQTARQSLIPMIVPQEQVLNAVSLNMTALNVMRVAGPGLAAVLLVGGDTGPVYLLAGILGVGVLVTLSLMHIEHTPREDMHEASWVDDLRSGWQFVTEHGDVLTILIPPIVMFMFGIPYISVFVPLFAKDVLDLGDSGVGALMMVTGAGAIVGSLILASQTNIQRSGLLIIALMSSFGTLLALFSRITFLPLSIIVLMLVSSMSTSFMALTNSLLLQLSPDKMRGRVLSLMSIDRGLVPIGAIVAGALASSLDAQNGLLVTASIFLGLTVVMALVARPLRRI